MSAPHPARPVASISQRRGDQHRGFGRTFPSRALPARAPEALLRVGGDGTCLEVISFEEFEALPRPSALIGAHVGEVLPAPVARLAETAIHQMGGVVARELMSGRRRLRVEVRPSRDETCWVRLTDVTDLNRRANEPDVDPQVSSSADPGGSQVHLDTTGRVVHWGSAVARLTGLPTERALGRSLSTLTAETDTWTNRVARAIPLGSDEHREFEEWLWQRNGQRHFVSISLVRSAAGYTLFLRNLTTQRLRDSRAATLSAVSGAALAASSVDDLARRTLAAMCETLDWDVGVFWQVDASAHVMRCLQVTTGAGLQLPDADAPERDATVEAGAGLAGRVWADGFADSVVDGFRDHPVFARVRFVDELRSGFAFPIHGAVGIFGVFEFASRAVEDTGAELLRTAAIISDYISQFADRLRAEQALRTSDAQKASILSNALDGIVTIDIDGRIVELNPEAERTFAATKGAMLGRGLGDFTAAPDDKAKLQVELTTLGESSATAGPTGRRLQVRAVRADGEEFPADLSITRIPLDGPAHFSVCIRDLSEQERLQGALHHAQKMESLGLLASGIAHDFNNFLTVIRGQAERLLKNLPNDDTRRRWVSSILKVSERASALTGQLLAFGRREASHASVVDLNAIVESTAGLLSQQLGDRVSWDATLAPDAGQARIAEGEVQQILFNLALNARDAMPDGGQLAVSTRRVDLTRARAHRLLLSPGAYVLLSVRDSGRGMDARTQSRVFEPFFTTKKLGEGTGLGLSTVYALVQQCGGQVSVSSRVGRGTTFDVYLPRVGTPEAEGVEAPRSSTRSELAGLTVLLVEDDDEIREIMSDTLTEHGADVLQAIDGESALEQCATRGRTMDLLVTDVMMPGMNGHQLAELVTQQRPDLPVIFVSGHPEAAIGPDRLNGRSVSLLRKPFSSEELVTRVRDVAETSRRSASGPPAVSL